MSTISKSASSCSDEDVELRRGPWTVEEDKLLIHYIDLHGEGRWNLLAKCSGLRRTGKSCRLRWLNYLKPDVKRGNLSPQEQLLILELHSKWGNRWSRIAQHLPGRTDNEIKNYWRTRVLKQARNLKIDSNSAAFHEMIRNLWIPRLLQKIQSSTTQNSPPSLQVPCSNLDHCQKNSSLGNCTSSSISSSDQSIHISEYPQISEYPISPFNAMGNNSDYNTLLEGFCSVDSMESFSLSPTQSAMGDFRDPIVDCHVAENSWNGDMEDNLWNMDELWQFR